MKKLTTLLCLLSLSLLVVGQNMYFKKFGTNYDSLKNFIESREEMDLILDGGAVMIAGNDQLVMTYFFADGVLYKTMLQKSYDSRRDAQVGMESLANYYKLLKTEFVQMEDEKSQGHFLAQKGSESHEVYRISSGDADSRIQIVSLSAEFDPNASKPDLTPEGSLISMAIH